MGWPSTVSPVTLTPGKSPDAEPCFAVASALTTTLPTVRSPPNIEMSEIVRDALAFAVVPVSAER